MEQFAEEIARALEHLYDLAFLESSPLAMLAGGNNPSQRSPGRALRKALSDAIESLRPPEGTPSDDYAARRPHLILQGRYVEGLTHTEIEQTLHLSRSQYYREHARAVQAVAAMLWSAWHLDARPTSRQELPVVNADALALAELIDLARQEPAKSLDLRDILVDLETLLASPSPAEGVALRLSLGDRPLPVHASRIVMRQSLLLALTRCAGSVTEGSIEVQAELRPHEVVISITPHGICRQELQPAALADLESYFGIAGGSLTLKDDTTPRSLCLTFPLGSTKRTVLLVDNNPELADLFRRYLEGEPWSLLHASSVRQALDTCELEPPDAVLLDVLMPQHDGWTLLSRLKSSSATASIPVVICSVLNQPELARSLGAMGYLRKPVTQESLKEALARCAQPPDGAR